MGTSYKITEDLYLDEMSCEVEFAIRDELTKPLSSSQLRTAIIKQIEVLSYLSDDADEVLKRFNVKYGQTE